MGVAISGAHADVTGAAVVVLKAGKTASPQEKLEAAQFAVCYSRAWKHGFSNADAYAVERSQVHTASSGEYVSQGGFVLRGKREWFKNDFINFA